MFASVLIPSIKGFFAGDSFWLRPPEMAESTGKWTFGPRDIPGGVQWTASSAEDIAACSALPAEVQAETLRASVSLGPYAWDVLVRAVRTPGASKVALSPLLSLVPS